MLSQRYQAIQVQVKDAIIVPYDLRMQCVANLDPPTQSELSSMLDWLNQATRVVIWKLEDNDLFGAHVWLEMLGLDLDEVRDWTMSLMEAIVPQEQVVNGLHGLRGSLEILLTSRNDLNVARQQLTRRYEPLPGSLDDSEVARSNILMSRNSAIHETNALLSTASAALQTVGVDTASTTLVAAQHAVARAKTTPQYLEYAPGTKDLRHDLLLPASPKTLAESDSRRTPSAATRGYVNAQDEAVRRDSAQVYDAAADEAAPIFCAVDWNPSAERKRRRSSELVSPKCSGLLSKQQQAESPTFVGSKVRNWILDVNEQTGLVRC